MGCNLCDECSDCTVGDALDCGMWDPEGHQTSNSSWDYDYDSDSDCCEYTCDEVVGMSINEEQHCVKCGGKVADEWSHCPRCGSLVPSSYEGVPAPPSPIAPPSIRPSTNATVGVYDDDIPF